MVEHSFIFVIVVEEALSVFIISYRYLKLILPSRCYSIEHSAYLIQMELLNIKYGWLFALELLLVTANHISLTNGQQGIINTCIILYFMLLTLGDGQASVGG